MDNQVEIESISYHYADLKDSGMIETAGQWNNFLESLNDFVVNYFTNTGGNE